MRVLESLRISYFKCKNNKDCQIALSSKSPTSQWGLYKPSKPTCLDQPVEYQATINLSQLPDSILILMEMRSIILDKERPYSDGQYSLKMNILLFRESQTLTFWINLRIYFLPWDLSMELTNIFLSKQINSILTTKDYCCSRIRLKGLWREKLNIQ